MVKTAAISFFEYVIVKTKIATTLAHRGRFGSEISVREKSSILEIFIILLTARKNAMNEMFSCDIQQHTHVALDNVVLDSTPKKTPKETRRSEQFLPSNKTKHSRSFICHRWQIIASEIPPL